MEFSPFQRNNDLREPKLASQSWPISPIHVSLSSWQPSPILLDNNSEEEEDDVVTPVYNIPDDVDEPLPPVSSGLVKLLERRRRLAQQRVQLEQRLYGSTTALVPSRVSSLSFADSLTRRLDVTNRSYATYTYTGPIDHTTGRPDGVGRMVFRNGQIYQGEIVQGYRQGRGENRWTSATTNLEGSTVSTATTTTRHDEEQVYVGSWYQDQRHGRGTHRWLSSGRSVTGQWYQGHLHGRVYMQWPDGTCFDGEASVGKKHGRGMYSWPDGHIYSGHYSNGRAQGYAILTRPFETIPQQQSTGTDTTADRPTSYRGQFLNGKRHGYGIQVWQHKTYDGEWFQNRAHGRGKLVWRNGHGADGSEECSFITTRNRKYHSDGYYTGEFQYGKFHGSGCYYTTPSGYYSYVGQWNFGKQHGTGRQVRDGRVYSGGFFQGQQHGYGRLTLPDGSLYTGGWCRGQRSGRGIQLAADGTVAHCGLWDKDRVVVKESCLLTTQDDTVVASRVSATNSPAGVSSSQQRINNDNDTTGVNTSSNSRANTSSISTLTLSPGNSKLLKGSPKFTLFWEI